MKTRMWKITYRHKSIRYFADHGSINVIASNINQAIKTAYKKIDSYYIITEVVLLGETD